MIDTASTGIAAIFLGLLILIVGYTKRDTKFGPFLIGLGVACMLSVIVYSIFTALA